MTNDLIRREAAMKFTTPEDWGTPDERWRPESEYGKFIEALPPAQQWIPVSERLPEELKPVNITWVNRMPESYYKDIKDKPFTATGVYFCKQWYWWSTLCTDMLSEYGRNHCDRVDEHIEIIAWMELPEPYKESEG